jgi:hypothetical protein
LALSMPVSNSTQALVTSPSMTAATPAELKRPTMASQPIVDRTSHRMHQWLSYRTPGNSSFASALGSPHAQQFDIPLPNSVTTARDLTQAATGTRSSLCHSFLTGVRRFKELIESDTSVGVLRR